jgi:hypothetical protein
VLAFADDPQPKNGRNYINIMPIDTSGQFFTGSDPITTVDLESHLNDDGSFSKTATVDGDWIVSNTYIIKNGGEAGGKPIPDDVLKRFALGTFTWGGSPPVALKNQYQLSNTGQLARK